MDVFSFFNGSATLKPNHRSSQLLWGRSLVPVVFRVCYSYSATLQHLCAHVWIDLKGTVDSPPIVFCKFRAPGSPAKGPEVVQACMTGLVHLYFGCRNETDFLHRAQLEIPGRCVSTSLEVVCSLRGWISWESLGSLTRQVCNSLARTCRSCGPFWGSGMQKVYVLWRSLSPDRPTVDPWRCWGVRGGQGSRDDGGWGWKWAMPLVLRQVFAIAPPPYNI